MRTGSSPPPEPKPAPATVWNPTSPTPGRLAVDTEWYAATTYEGPYWLLADAWWPGIETVDLWPGYS